MKPILLILSFVLILGPLGGQVVNESGQPSKGEWHYKPQLIWGVDSAGDDLLVRDGGIQADDAGNVYFLEYRLTRIFVFSPEGKFLHSFGKKGEGPGEFKMAFDFSLMNETVIVPDMGRFHLFSTAGKFIRSINPGVMIFPRAFLDNKRMIYVNELGEDEKKFEEMRLFNLDTKKERTIKKIEKEETLTASTGGMTLQLRDPSTTPGLIVTAAGEQLYWGRSDEYLIHKTDLQGNDQLTFSLKGRERKKIPESFKRKKYENVILNGSRMPKDMVDQMVKNMPDYSVFFNRITIDESGIIYVFVSDAQNEMAQEIDIFSPSGEFLYHSVLTLPGKLVAKSPLVIKKNYLYVFAEDEDGEGKLYKFKIQLPTIQS